jgi:hypothetical protein
MELKAKMGQVETEITEIKKALKKLHRLASFGFGINF